MIKMLFGDRIWGIGCLATAAIGTVTTYTLNHINLCCLIIVSISTTVLTTVKILKELRSGDIDKTAVKILKLAEENRESIEKLKTEISSKKQ
jgi:hypothetical protein